MLVCFFFVLIILTLYDCFYLPCFARTIILLLLWSFFVNPAPIFPFCPKTSLVEFLQFSLVLIPQRIERTFKLYFVWHTWFLQIKSTLYIVQYVHIVHCMSNIFRFLFIYNNQKSFFKRLVYSQIRPNSGNKFRRVEN